VAITLPCVIGWTVIAHTHTSARRVSSCTLKMTGMSIVECEVVGASGRMGSRLLKVVEGSRAVPRGLCPGGLSFANKPIYVATPSKAWLQVLQDTPPERRDDLVWIGNGLPLAGMEHATFCVPHYAVLATGQTPVTSSASPPTYAYGKHAATVARLLQADGIQMQTVSWSEVRVAAARKLLWATCMWLLCHASSQTLEPPLTVSEVHFHRQDQLGNLVREVWPALQHEIGVAIVDSDIDKTLAYMKAYSESIPNAVPSKELAVREIQERSGVSLRRRDAFAQPSHQKLLLQVGGPELLSRALEAPTTISSSRHQRVHLKALGLVVSGTRRL